MLRIFTILLLFVVFEGFAQFDTSFVHINKETFSVASITEFYTTSYHIKYNKTDDGNVSLPENVENSYHSQNSLYTGLSFSFKRLGFTLSFRLPYMDNKKLKDSKSFVFSGGYSFRRLYGELNVKRFDGLMKKTIYHQEDDIEEITDIREKLRVTHVEGMLYYFNSGRFNYDASFKNFHMQKKSAVSFSTGYGLAYHDFKGKMDVVKLISDSVGQTEKRTQILSTKLLPGIGTVFVVEDFYLAVNTLLGLSLNYNLLDSEKSKFTIFPNLMIKSAIGYNHKRFFVSLMFTYENDLIPLSYNDLSIRNYAFQIKLGYRISNRYLFKLERFL